MSIIPPAAFVSQTNAVFLPFTENVASVVQAPCEHVLFRMLTMPSSPSLLQNERPLASLDIEVRRRDADIM